MIRNLLFSILVISFITTNYSQTISAKLLDNETKEPIPYATIQFSDTDGVMSNEEGTFEFEINENQVLNDSIIISSLGYKTTKYLKESLPEELFLIPEIYKIAPVVLSTNKMTAKEIIKEVKENLNKNYAVSYTQRNAFFRETYKQQVKKLKIKLKKSTIDNIDQNLFDTIVGKMPKDITSLLESYGETYTKDLTEGKVQLKKLMIVRSKQEKTAMKAIQDDFLQALKENAKPNSYLIIKTGILRIDKTESIDSITKPKKPKTIKKGKELRMNTQKYRNQHFNTLLNDLVINPDTRVNFLDKSYKYEFTKVGYVELEDDLVYVIDFKPKSKAKYKGKLYIHTKDFAIIKSEIQSAKPIFDKHFNLFGIKNNDLSFKNTNIFKKDSSGKYRTKYIKTEMISVNSMDRPFKIIEKNKIVKGRNTQNKVSLRFVFSMYNTFTKEIVFNDGQSLSKAKYDAVKLNSDYKIGRFTAYNKDFWKGYKIITPEKAIQELKID
ncbi:MAG TPA: hypothetical protein EYG92_10555 [Lutibacter sp.]|nr:hypothetical protein [Lutibacter sp.]